MMAIIKYTMGEVISESFNKGLLALRVQLLSERQYEGMESNSQMKSVMMEI